MPITIDIFSLFYVAIGALLIFFMNRIEKELGKDYFLEGKTLKHWLGDMIVIKHLKLMLFPSTFLKKDKFKEGYLLAVIYTLLVIASMVNFYYLLLNLGVVLK